LTWTISSSTVPTAAKRSGDRGSTSTEPRALSEREHEGLDPGVEELDLEQPVADRL
jgi:hypothetical protein